MSQGPWENAALVPAKLGRVAEKNFLLCKLTELKGRERTHWIGFCSEKYPRMKGMQGSTVLLNIAAMVEGVDDSLLPAVFSEMALDLDVGLTALGLLIFIRSLVQAFGSPFAAYWAMHHNRVNLVGAGAVIWAISTVGLGFSTLYWQTVLARILNGIGLAIVSPALMSLVADVTGDEDRGLAFGWLYGAGQCGTIFGGVMATRLGSHTVFGMAGWRAALFIAAILSVMVGAAVLLLGHDPRSHRGYRSVRENDEMSEKGGAKADAVDFLNGSKFVLGVKSFQVVVAEGIVGSIPVSAMVFLTLWVELIGFSHSTAGVMVAMVPFGKSFGSIFGGWIGDKAASCSANKGRIIIAQLSSATGIAAAVVLLLVLPKDVALMWVYGLVMLTAGFFMAWTLPATNGPIFAEIVPKDLRTTVYAVDLAFERSLAATGAPLVGFLAEHAFGFQKMAAKGSVSTDLPNANALGTAMLACISIPDALCIIIVSILCCTYPKDRDRAKTFRTPADGVKSFEFEERWATDVIGEDEGWADGFDSIDDEQDLASHGEKRFRTEIQIS